MSHYKYKFTVSCVRKHACQSIFRTLQKRFLKKKISAGRTGDRKFRKAASGEGVGTQRRAEQGERARVSYIKAWVTKATCSAFSPISSKVCGV